MLLVFHKPYGVLSQFTPHFNSIKKEAGFSSQSAEPQTLSEFGFPKNVYPIGRLDSDSEGLLFLSDERKWNDLLLHPRHEQERIYHAQVEGLATEQAMSQLQKGLQIQDYKSKPCKARLLPDPGYPPRNPPIRVRLKIPTSWVELILIEGKNRQVRRMTAAVGFPTLRLLRVGHGGIKLGDLPAGKWRELDSRERKLLAES